MAIHAGVDSILDLCVFFFGHELAQKDEFFHVHLLKSQGKETKSHFSSLKVDFLCKTDLGFASFYIIRRECLFVLRMIDKNLRQEVLRLCLRSSQVTNPFWQFLDHFPNPTDILLSSFPSQVIFSLLVLFVFAILLLSD